MDWAEIEKELSKKLDPKHVKPPKKFGPKGDYIEGWHAIAEANRIFGPDAWSYEIKECLCVSERPRKIGRDQRAGFGVSYTARVSVTVGNTRREDMGAGHGYDLDCGAAHESAVKEAVTDALKRCLRTYGNPFGLALYDKTRESVGVDEPEFIPAAFRDRLKPKLETARTWPDLSALIEEIKSNASLMPEPMLNELRTAADKRKEYFRSNDPAMQHPHEEEHVGGAFNG